MNLTRDRLASIGWVSILVSCGALTTVLMLRVNAVKSQVQLAERHIVELQREKQFLETEYETRANQQQLASLNDLDFGYKAPGATQYLESERQLAVLGKPRGPDAPAPILMASADAEAAAAALPAVFSPITGKLVGSAHAAEPDGAPNDPSVDARTLGSRLSHVRHRPSDHGAADEGTIKE